MKSTVYLNTVTNHFFIVDNKTFHKENLYLIKGLNTQKPFCKNDEIRCYYYLIKREE